MKKTLAILLAVLMTLTLFAACGSKTDRSDADTKDSQSDPTPESTPETTPAPVDPTDALREAYEKQQQLHSVHTDLVEEVSLVMKIPAYSMEQSMDVSYNLSIDSQKDPEVVRMEGSMSAMGTVSDVLYYGVEDGDNVQTYVSTDKGKTWTAGSSDVSGLAEQMESMNSWLGNVEAAERTGTETVNGVETTVYSCTIPGSVFAQSNDMLSSLGAGLDASLLDDLEPVPATVWVGNDNGMVVRLRIEMGDFMLHILDKAMEAQMGSAGADLGIEWEISLAYVEVTSSQFDAVPTIVIPEEAKGTGSTDAPVVSGDGIVGTWELCDGEGEEAQQTVAMLLAFGMTMEITFNEDGTGAMATTYSGETESEDFTYTLEGDQIVIDGDPAPYRIEGDLLYITMDDESLIFKRK